MIWGGLSPNDDSSAGCGVELLEWVSDTGKEGGMEMAAGR